jgi:dipeptidyl aminopeptidase/acylaminoacyl peptidase
MSIIRPLLIGLVGLLPASAVAQTGTRPITIEEFVSMDRVSDPRISPDARWVAYTVTSTSLETNGRTSHVWLQSVDGGAARRVSDEAGGHGARWSPDGATLAYVSGSAVSQIVVYDIAARRARPLTSLVTGVDGIVWSPTGTHVAFVSDVYPECRDEACNRQRLAEEDARPTDVRTYDELLYRHWTEWEDGRRSHLFVVPLAGGVPTDLIPGADYDVPVPPFGGSEDYAFSVDGQFVYYTTKTGRDRAWHTNADISRVPVAGGPAVNVTASLAGAERHPAPSPDGRLLAFLSQERAGFESDRWRLLVQDPNGGRQVLTAGLDRSVHAFEWLPNSSGLLFTAQDGHRTAIYRVDLDSRVRQILGWGNTGAFSLADDGNTLALVNDAMDRPGQVYVWRMGGREEPRRLTNLNAPLLTQVRLQPAEEMQWVGAGGRTIRGLMLRPPQFRQGERYPLVVLIHGGPQGAWLDNFHARWNAQLFAAPGYVVALLNPRGSTGFGQRFVDEISQDWGGRVYTDIMAGVEHAARFRYVDSTRMAAAGGSYGGYMVNWINAHSTRFDALISHAGLFNLEAFYGATEELWFPEWEFGGPPWVNRTWYDRWSPHRFADGFQTPTLVIHGARDYRVSDTQGLAMFTALRRQDVPTRLVYFPDEGHWISKPANQRVWWTEVQEWLVRYLRP